MANVGFSITHRYPIWQSSGASIGSNEIPDFTTYSHVRDAEVGFRTATIGFGSTSNEMSLWGRYGLGRHVEVHNKSGVIIWEGFVNEVSMDYTQSTVTLACVGYFKFLEYPFENFASGSYTQREKVIDALTNEPNTLFSTDYALIEANSLSVLKAETNKKTGLQVIKELVALGGSSNNNRRIFGIGAGQKAYIYEIPDTTLYYTNVPSSAKVGPLDKVVNRATTRYKDNVTGSQAETGVANDTASQTKYGIKQKVLAGGEISSTNATSIRDTYLNENAYPETSQSVSGTFQVYLAGDVPVDPWDVEPGQWIEFTSITDVGDPSIDNRQNIRKMFIENINFSAPQSLSLTGNKVGTLPQKLAKLGLGTI